MLDWCSSSQQTQRHIHLNIFIRLIIFAIRKKKHILRLAIFQSSALFTHNVCICVYVKHNIKNGVYGNKWWCSHLIFAFWRKECQRSKKNSNTNVTCECTFSISRDCRLFYIDWSHLHILGYLLISSDTSIYVTILPLTFNKMRSNPQCTQ